MRRGFQNIWRAVAPKIGTYLETIEATDLHRLRSRMQSLVA